MEELMQKRFFVSLLLVVTLTFFIFSLPLHAAPAKDKIKIGWVTSLSGPYASSVAPTYGMAYELWIDEVNARGGILVKEYGKRLPLEVIKYDDKSDVGTMTKLLEKAILQDKVDFVFSPWSTANLFAAAPIVNKHKKVMLGGPGGAIKLKEIMKKGTYFFSVLNMADTQMPPLVQILAENNAKKVAIIYIEDLHGIEYRDVLLPELKKKGIEVVFSKSFPFGTKDLTPLLKDAKAANVDAFIGIVYPDEAFLATGQSMEIGFSPKAFFLTVGPFLSEYRNAFGKNAEGIIGSGAWNEKVSPAAKQFKEAYTKKFNVEPAYWGPLFFYSACQFFEQAIETAGTLDQTKIRDIIATKTFTTAMGPMKFEKGFNTTSPGEIGQWQKGVFEIIDPGKKRTAPPIYPKPAWQPPEPKK
jgi:branched-chain amino acid transport system substrate-binding protein